MAKILEQGAEAGTLRADVVPDDVTTMLVGVFLAITAGAPRSRPIACSISSPTRSARGVHNEYG
ncbi:hypothetical protein [Streptomyces milbemycinicus]